MTEALEEIVSWNFTFSCASQMPPFATTSPQKFQRVAGVQEDDESNQSFLVKTWHEAQRAPLDEEEIYLRETKDVVLFYTRTQCETGHRLGLCVDTSHKCHAVLILIHKKCRLDICLATRCGSDARVASCEDTIELVWVQQSQPYPQKAIVYCNNCITDKAFPRCSYNWPKS